MTALTDLDAAISALGTAQTKLGAVRTALTTAPPPPPPPGPGAGPSGIAWPNADIPGWKYVFGDHFTKDVPLGSFPAAVADKWGSYGAGMPLANKWPCPPSYWAHYYPERVVSIRDSVMDCYFHTLTENDSLGKPWTIHAVCTNQPKLNGQLIYLPHGRIAICWRVAEPSPHYKTAYLLWPKSDDDHTLYWPQAGEIDFPELPLNGNIAGFMHRMNATSGGDQDGWQSGIPAGTGWHVSVIEWTPSSCQFSVDGVKGPLWTNRVPVGPMRYAIQHGGAKDGNTAPANPTIPGRIHVDWVSLWQPA